MKKRLVIVGAFALSFVSTKITAQQTKKQTETLEKVVVTATKFALKKEHTGKVIYKITQKEIQNNAGKSVAELLNNLPGIEINGTKSFDGEIKGIYFRGGRSRQVLVLIDGVPVSDPTGVNQTFDLRLLSLNDIESIEVLKGAASTLYGSGAATGVINIILKKASKKEFSFQLETNLGTNNTAITRASSLSDRNQNLSVNGTLGKISYLGYFNISSVNGLSAAKSNTNTVFKNDTFYKENSLFKITYQATEKLNFESFINYDNYNYTYDAGAYQDSDINNGKQKQVRFGFKPSYAYNNGQVYLLASINKLNRGFESFNSWTNATDVFDYKGESINIDLVNKFSFSDGKYQLITGVQYQTHNNTTNSPYGNIDADIANFNMLDPYASLVYISNYGLNVNLGARYNMHSNYGNHLVYDANISYGFLKSTTTNIKLIASYGTAFIAPSTYQLFSQFGNVDLNPETSITTETGFEVSYKNFINFNAVYFQRNEDDAIIFQSLAVAPWTSQYVNAINTIKVNGIETDITIHPVDKVRLQLGYTYTNKDKNADYIPKSKFITNLEVETLKNTFLSLVYKNVGERTYFDKWGSFGVANTEIILPKYSLLDININYKILENTVTFFGSISNILDEDYEEILGYNTRGRNYKLGIRLNF